MNDKKCCNEKTRSEFVEILDGFKMELAKLDDNSNMIMDRIYLFRNIREPITAPCEKQENKNGIIGELEDCIRLMADYNNRLKEIREVLIKFVG